MMLDRASKIVHALHPPGEGDDPHSWRQSVFYCLIVLIILCVGGLLMDSGALAKIGIHHVARADEVDAKIEARIGPLETKVESTERTGKAILRALYLPQVRAKVRERCETTGRRERAAINTELDRIKEEYRMLSGEALGPDPTCNEV